MINLKKSPTLFSITFSLAIAMITSLGVSASWAGDPFRTTNPRNIDSKTEAAFIAIFREGNYKQARQFLDQATEGSSNEPLVYAMKASLYYDSANLEEMRVYADKTLQTAEKLKEKDPLRGNLYLAVGHFMEGAYLLKKGSYLEAVSKTGQVFDYLETASKIDPNDPEFNLLRGYLDLFLSKYTPFSQSEQVIVRFEKYASPNYLKNRALTTTYRDLKKYDKAMEYMDKAIAETPENPELQYLKGQLLRLQGRANKNLDQLKASQSYFEMAKQKEDQLPQSVVIQVNHEYNAVKDEIQKLEANPNLSEF